MEEDNKRGYTIRVPLAQYSYLETLVFGTPEEAIALHNECLKKYQDSLKEPEVQTGLDNKAWQMCLDQYMEKGTIATEDMECMSDRQKLLINEIKKCFARINRQYQ